MFSGHFVSGLCVLVASCPDLRLPFLPAQRLVTQLVLYEIISENVLYCVCKCVQFRSIVGLHSTYRNTNYYSGILDKEDTGTL